MMKNITPKDLILYHYNECNPETKLFIDNNLDTNPSWKEYLSQLNTISSACISNKNPNPTSINIILEESAGKEQHSF